MKIISETNSLTFLNILNGLEIIPQDKHPESVFWGKNGKIYFEEDHKNEVLWCEYYLVWLKFYLIHKRNGVTTSELIKGMVERYTEWKGLTPATNRCRSSKRWKDIQNGRD